RGNIELQESANSSLTTKRMANLSAWQCSPKKGLRPSERVIKQHSTITNQPASMRRGAPPKTLWQISFMREITKDPGLTQFLYLKAGWKWTPSRSTRTPGPSCGNSQSAACTELDTPFIPLHFVSH